MEVIPQEEELTTESQRHREEHRKGKKKIDKEYRYLFFVFIFSVWTSPQMVDTQLRVYNHLGRSSNGKNATYLHPGVQSRSRQARHRARLLRRRGCTFSRTQSKPHPQLEASSPGAGPTRLSRSWQALSLGGGEPPTPGRE